MATAATNSQPARYGYSATSVNCAPCYAFALCIYHTLYTKGTLSWFTPKSPGPVSLSEQDMNIRNKAMITCVFSFLRLWRMTTPNRLKRADF